MFNQDYNDLLRLFSARSVNYVIVGAYATPENAGAVFASLVDFGAPLSGVTEVDFRTPGTVYQIGVPPNRIDILTDMNG